MNCNGSLRRRSARDAAYYAAHSRYIAVAGQVLARASQDLRLHGRQHLESDEVSAIVGDLYSGHYRMGRTALRPRNDLLDGIVCARNDRFDAAVVPVAHPTGYSEVARHSLHMVAIANALNAAPDSQMFDSRHYVSGGTRVFRPPGCS